MDAENSETSVSSDGGAPADPASMRGEPRDSMLLMGTLRRASGEDLSIRVRNLSGGGLMAEVPTSLLKDEAVEIDLRGIGLVAGRVAWIAGARVGIAFDRPVDHKLARRPVAAGEQPQLLRVARVSWRPGLR